ncbi:MAG: futalosine hydrolase [Deltaproteobacteria bacterium]|nr:futalosine hydrolase [Deltaproteobacteria bacterium]
MPMIVFALATASEHRATFDSDRPLSGPSSSTSLITGIGPVNAAAGLAAFLAVNPSVCGVVNLGVAGTFSTVRAALGKTVVVEHEIWPEFGLYTDSGLDPEALGFALAQIDGRPVWDRLDLDPDRAARDMGLALDPEWKRGPSLTVAGVTGTPERARHLSKLYDALLENMEGFALALVCAGRRIPFLEIRTVSNLVGSRRPEDWALHPALNRLSAIRQHLIPGRSQPCS